MAEITREQWPELNVKLAPMETHLSRNVAKLTFHLPAPLIVDRPGQITGGGALEVPLPADACVEIADFLGSIADQNGHETRAIFAARAWEKRCGVAGSAANVANEALFQVRADYALAMEVIADQAVALFRSFREEKRQRTNAEDWQKQAANNQSGQDHWEREYTAALVTIGAQEIMNVRQQQEIERLDGYRDRLVEALGKLSDEAQAIEDRYNADDYSGDLEADELEAETIRLCVRRMNEALFDPPVLTNASPAEYSAAAEALERVAIDGEWVGFTITEPLQAGDVIQLLQGGIRRTRIWTGAVSDDTSRT